MNKEKQLLVNKKKQLEKEIKDINSKISTLDKQSYAEFKDKYGVSPNDTERHCRQYYNCNKCIIPCESCHDHYCEQCRYGYKSIVEQLKIKYSDEEIKSFENKCPYARLVLLKKELEIK